MDNNLIIFTDLDGTLLNSKYSFKKAIPALELVIEKNIPLILCTSKTRAEVEHYRKKLKNAHPFVSENGGGIFIPRKYFKFQIKNSRFQIENNGKYYLMKLGASYDDLRKALIELRSEGFNVKGFGDMSIEEVARLTGLKITEAKMAKERDFDEPFLFKGNETSLRKLKQYVKAKGFNITQGEFFHIMGDSNKGRAVGILKRLYASQYRKLITAALGDGPNDIGMLKEVDYPILVQKEGRTYDRRVRIRGIIRSGGVGPEGWNKGVLKLLETLSF